MSEPETKITCKRHGESHATFVCGHLPRSLGAGFFFGESDDPRPDAWCIRCDEVVAAVGEWNDESEDFANVTVICAGCYDEVRARNTRRESKSPGRFTCSSCNEVHDTLPLDLGAAAPSLPREELARAKRTTETLELDEDRFVRACLELPLADGTGPFVYGVWVTLSEKNYGEFVSRMKDTQRFTDGPYFGWFSNELAGWPSTMNLKARVHVRPPPLRPVLELEPTDHPLAVAQREGLSVEKYRELVLAAMHAA